MEEMSANQYAFARWWRRQSIERTLPAAFTLLLAFLVSFYVIAAFRAIEHSASEAALERVRGVGKELGELLVTQNQQRAAVVARVVSAPGFAAALADPQRAGIDSLLQRLATGSDSSAILLLDRDLQVVARTGLPATPAAMERIARPARDAMEQKGRVQRSPFFVDGARAYYWALTTVGDSTGNFGFVAQLRRIGNSSQSSSNALDRIMAGTTVLFSNMDGGAEGTWLMMDGRLSEPPISRATKGGNLIHNRADGAYFAHSVSIAGTPWMLTAEMPRAEARARALAFVRDTAPVAIVIVLLGAFLAWLLAHRYAQPMRALARAAQGIAAGDYTQRVHNSRRDELGRLADAFNLMATEVESSDSRVRHLNSVLEDRVRHRTAELEAVNMELRAFSYSVSHDLRSPLRGMDGFSQALLEDYNDALDETGRDYLRRIRLAAQRMGRLIDDLLLLSKVTLHPIVREDVDLTALANEMIADVRHADPARSVDVHVEEGLRVNGDRGLLRVALQNLISNAWKFTAGRPDARIEVGRSDPESEEFFVRDNGAGFDMAYADRLFTPFQRLHSEQEFKGTGIGLATVQRVMMRHGGSVRAQATVNGGATFFFNVNGGG